MGLAVTTFDEDLAWAEAFFPAQAAELDGLGDHLIGDDEAFESAEPFLRMGERQLLTNGARALIDVDGEFIARVASADGSCFGSLICHDTDGGFNAYLASVKTDPADPRLRCLEWLHDVRGVAMAGVVGSFGDELGFGGEPVVLPRAGRGDAVLSWKCQPGGVLVYLGETGRACGACMGCKSVVETQERAATSWVYFIQSTQGGPVKIGYSTNPIGRLSTLQTAHAHPLKIIGRMAGGIAVERSLHTLFAADRVRSDGEWFRPSAALLAFIREVGGAG